MAEQPTAEEIAAYEARFGPAKPQVNPLRDLSAEDIATLAVKDKEHFVIPDEFARAKELHGDAAFVQKVADAFNIVNQRGFKAEDLPTVPQAGKAVGTAIKGLAGQIWNYANVAGNIVAGTAAELTGQEGLASGYAENIDKRLAENVAGTEEAMTGIAQLAQKGARKVGQKTGITKDFSEYTPAEKVTELFNKSGESEVRSERLVGKGEFSKAVTSGVSEEVGLDPEKVGELAAGDPFSFYLFGAGAGAAGKVLKAATPAIVRGAAATVTRGVGRLAEEIVPKAVGGGLTAAGVTAKGAAKAVETVAPAAGAIGGGVVGGASFGVPGAIGGVGAGLATGKAIARGASFAGRQAEKIADIGRQISGSVPIKSAYTQAGRDFLQALPGATWDVAKGTALDIGLAAATAEVPQDVQGAVGFGTALGALGGAAKVGGRVLSGQLIAPRAYGVNTVLPSSGQFRGFDAMHADAIKAATPGVRARLNAMRDFAQGVAPGTDIFLGRDSATVKKALLDAGLDPGLAESWSQAEGFFTANLPGKDGKPRRVVIATNVDSVPHEAQHVIQDVLGEQANQKIDALIRDTYADSWDAEGQKYADRITEGRDPRNWREVVLDETGTGLSEAKEKIYRDIANQLEGDTGMAPSPKLVEVMAKAELGRVMDEAVIRHPDADPNAIGRHVWRDVFADSPGDVVTLSDKYIAREIAAENFDALFKNQGPRLAEGTQLPQQLARIVARVVTGLGGEPLAGRTSELGGLPLSTPVIAAVRGAAKGLQGETPIVTSRSEGIRIAPGAPEAAEEARALAAEAPAEIAVGGTRSPRELLGQIAESIANQEGVKINYLSAPGEPAAATTSNRTVRREIIEAFRTMPPEARALWEKTFFPERVTRTKSGAYQIQGWAPEVFASNAHKVAKFFAETPDAQALSPYAVDVASKTFTPDAWQELYVDTQNFVQNQMRGVTGSGEPLVVPRSVTEAGGFAPPVRPGAVPLAQGKADFINALFNFKIPETPRIQVGKRPLNVVGQEVSQASIPGRVEVPVRPRGEYTGAEAARQKIEGVNIAEVNPFRNQLEAAAQAAGKPPPSFIEAIQKLNLENIKEVEGTPEAPQFRGNTLTLTAGLQPKAQLAARTDTGRRVAEERGFEIRHTGTPENPGVAIFKEGAPVGEISAVRNSAIEADIDNIKVNKDFRGQGLSEILYRELGKRLQDEGVETVTGMIIDKRALAGRSKVFPETRIENKITVGENAPAYEVRSPISATAQFSPVELAARVEKFTPEEFYAWTADPKGANRNFTGVAHDVGLQAPDRAFVDSLKQRYDSISKQAIDLMADIRKDPATMLDKLDAISALGSQGQFFREAYEAATGTASAGSALRKADPNYKPPFPIEEAPKVQLAPKKIKTKEEVQKMLGDEVVRMAADYPEALPLDYQKNKDGTIKLDKDNAPTPIEKNYALHDTPLAKRAAAGHDTKEAQDAAIVDAYADKLKDAYAEAAKNPAIIAGKDWYSLTRTKLQKLFGVDTKLFAEILGATSAQTPVDTNFRFAIDVYNKFKAGDYDAIIAKYKEGKDIWNSGDLSAARALDTENVLGENPSRAAFRKFWIQKHDLQPKQSNGKLFGSNSNAVLRVLDGSWREEVQGPKTPNFADNLSGDSFEATIDIWAARLMRRVGYEGGQWRILPKNESRVTDKDFLMSQKAFRKAGDEIGVSPDSLQAIMWFSEKDLWSSNGWTHEVGAKKSDFNALLDITTRAEGSNRLDINEIQPKGKAQLAPEKVSLVEPKKSSPTVVAMPQEDAEKIADAIYKAEGGAKARKPYGILSVKVADEAEARRVALNTIKNNYKRWQVAGKPGEYLEFLAGKYAPIGVANDPKSLNKNWLKNVKAGLAK